jgi:flagellar hook-associated protein 1
MSDLSRMLETAKSSLLAHRYAMDVTSQNIANANVEGYTRQRPVLESNLSVKTPFGSLGTGVDLQKVERIREGFLDQEIRNTNYQLGQSDQRSGIMSRIESYLNEPLQGGIATELDNFFTAFQNLAANPEDAGVRQSVIQQGVTLTKEFNYLSNGFQNVKIDVIRDVEGKVKEVNDLLVEIASLNKQIFTMQPAVANEYEDLRDKRLDELSKLIEIHTSKDQNGLINISTSGSTLVSGVDAFQVSLDATSERLNLMFKGTSTVLSSPFGEVGASIDAYNITTPAFNKKLNEVAQALMTEVNNLHSKGYGLKDLTTGIVSTGINFFSGTDAGNMVVNPDVLNNVQKLAASADGTEGNNQVALNIANIVDKQVFNGGTANILQYYRTLVTDIGYGSSDSQRLSDALSKRSANLENLKLSISGVSLDDVMVNLIKYQRSFDAAGKVVSTIDQMFETILNLVK